MRKRDEQLINLSRRLDALGISLTDQEALRRIEMTLQRWAERECNGEIERDETTGKVYAGYPGDAYGARRDRLYPVADKEAGALKRLAAIMAQYPYLWFYHQGDPRGCMLYVGKWLEMPSGITLPKGCQALPESLSGHYTRGVAVCL